MTDLVAFLRARLDEDEQAARAVRVPHSWHQGPVDDDPEWTDDEMVLWWPPEFHTPYEQDKHWRGLTISGPETAAHVARHDPARVLAEVDAKRRILDLQAAEPGQHPDFCGHDMHELPCPTLRLLVLPYAGHPDYRPEWAPDA